MSPRDEPTGAKEVDHSISPYSPDEHTHDHGSRELASLCTKCAKDNKKVAASKVPGKYIINSKSFADVIVPLPPARPRAQTTDDADQLPADAGGGGSSGGSRLSLHRSSIVKQEVLTGNSLSDLYDVQGSDLGKGSYGSVAKATDRRSGALRAVKTVFKPKIENVTRLKREILIMKALDHPNIIRLFEVYEDEKHLYLIMELCSGGELFDRIIKSGHLSERYAATIMRQVFSAIAYCHSLNIMHRDLKPENLLFADPSPISPLKVIDWGFAAQCAKNHRFSSVVGTPYYVAPEVLYGNYNKLCDLWSAGVILYILLSGYPPFHGKDNREILEKVKTGSYNFDTRAWRRVSDYAKDLVRRLLTYDPRRRLTAQEALQHPWIQFYNAPAVSGDTPLSNRLGNELINKFKLFRKANKMKQLALTAVAYQLSENDITTLHNLFSRIDKNSAGLLPKKVLESALKEMGVKINDEIRTLIDEIDTDGNGAIEYSEFIAACLDHKFYEQESVCKAAFRVFDLDGDGKISLEELHKVLAMNFVQQAFTREDIESIIKEVDLNNDMEIDFDEFMRMMRGSQKKKLEHAGSSNAQSSSSNPLSRTRFLFYRKFDGQT
eukprot:Blabericola_migrator_1__2700@NODE_1768_length_3821_cov_86_086841_g734_i3_p1_GENE_NODE_1768_length_3821_cov_86_086841_g734_i3NODE_1768_length_3821_cov_86_086841_g734_i3_p1_ORF_typecomplete_len607_score87_73Pkinase/PF00069_25/5_6e78Pkinase_Tyr/PF07714_17/2_3e43EFhand_7/PF13499_6/5_7e12EFhand_7/PF13499_6/3_1e16EFhand_8/PF13833_6/1_1e02EFhand_8/PF13833_6/4_1e06EFhand_8/PF13833_6/2_1e05EFhand_8/PF13833_6/3_3e09EFhand_11/PF08976_11/2_6e05EFhand_11/PF08976_11/4_3e11EFhand_1/PF00036_32/4_2e03EFhand_1/PF